MTVQPVTHTILRRHEQRRRQSAASIKERLDEMDRQEREADTVEISKEGENSHA